MGFKTFISEDKHQLLHLDHIEDTVFDGKSTTAVAYLQDIIDELSMSVEGKLTTQQKVDGAPSIIAGWSPDDGRFFVATKSFFNKTPKVNYTKEDVQRNHGHSKGLADKLEDALVYLPKSIKKGEILQGDFMFSQITHDVKTEIIQNQKVYSFTPNTITYAVPVDTDLGKRINKAKIGIIWHTTYTGRTLDSLSGKFSISDSSFTQTSDVYSRTTNVKIAPGTSKDSIKKMQKLLQEIKKDKNYSDDINIQNIKDFVPDIKIYINSKVRQGNNNFNKNEIGGLFDFLEQRHQKIIQKLKTDKSIYIKNKRYQEQLQELRGHAAGLYGIFKWFYDIRDLKLIILHELEKIEAPEGTYQKTSDGYAVTAPEGFVISNSPTTGIKFVNRGVFAANNFNNRNFG